MMNFRKRLSMSLLLALSIALSISAAPRTKAAIRAAAAQVFRQSPALSMSGAHRDELKTLQANKAYTVMGYKKGGFVIISNDDLVPAVIAYSSTVFSKNTKNEGFKWYLTAAENAINNIVAKGTPSTMVMPNADTYAPQVSSFISSEWGQERPYNDLCPEATASGTGAWQGYGGTGRAVTGCVATAMAQIMSYNGYPKKGTGTHSVSVKQADGTKKLVTVNYDESVYDWANMIDSYKGKYSEAQGKAVAKLMLDCGVAADMMYATDASGTYTQNACEGLRRNFGYPETTQMLVREDYSEEAWMDMVFNELNARRAILYAGLDSKNGGHAFVLCGYDASGKVWVNWGWEGNFDGFYDISLLNPTGNKFSEHQDMIIGFEGIHGELLQDTVSVSEPGKLSSLISDSTYNRISKLKVNGRINSTDLRTIRQIAGCDVNGMMLRSSLTELDLGDAESEAAKKETEDIAKANDDLIKDVKDAIGDKIAEVKLSQRLRSSAVCLVADEAGPSLSMEQTFAEMNNPMFKARRILEINPHHDLFAKLKDLHAAGKDSEEFKDYCDLLYTQALLIEGILPENPVAFAQKLAKMMAK